MKSRYDFVQGYRKALEGLGHLNETTVRILVDVYDQSLMEWEQAVVERLDEKIRKWESMMDVTDERLYSLGLRHAVDIVKGEEIDPYQD